MTPSETGTYQRASRRLQRGCRGKTRRQKHYRSDSRRQDHSRRHRHWQCRQMVDWSLGGVEQPSIHNIRHGPRAFAVHAGHAGDDAQTALDTSTCAARRQCDGSKACVGDGVSGPAHLQVALTARFGRRSWVPLRPGRHNKQSPLQTAAWVNRLVELVVLGGMGRVLELVF